jgi:hypothetical protein
MIRKGFSHREVAELTGVPVSSVGNIAMRTNAKREDGDIRGGSRVHGQVRDNPKRKHRSLRRCCSCGKEASSISPGWCSDCLHTPPPTLDKVASLSRGLEEGLGMDTDELRASTLVFSAAVLATPETGGVTAHFIRTLVGDSELTEEITKRYFESEIFTANGRIQIEECTEEENSLAVATAILCGAGILVKVSS